MQLAWNAYGDGLKVAVENIDLGVEDGVADGWGPACRHARRNGRPGRDHGIFGRPIVIEHCARETVWRWPVEFIPAGEQRAQGAIFRPPFLEHPLGQRRGDKCERNPFVGQPSQKLSRREPGLFIRDVDAGATRQIGPQLPDRRVEGRTRHLGRPVCGRHLIDPLVPGDQIHKAGVFNFHSFGLAGRARGVDDIGEMGGFLIFVPLGAG